MARTVIFALCCAFVLAMPVLAASADEEVIIDEGSTVSDPQSMQSGTISVEVDTEALEDVISELQDTVEGLAESQSAMSDAVDALLEAEEVEEDEEPDADDDAVSLDDILEAITATNDILLSATAVDDVYDGNISSTILTYFDRIVSKIPASSHYVLVRSSQYIYTLYYGEDLCLDNYVFAGTDVDWVQLDTSYTGNQSIYDISWGTSVDVSLDCSGLCVYSDLGLYPVLSADTASYVWLILFVLVVLCLCLLVRPWLANSYRWSSSAFGGVQDG